MTASNLANTLGSKLCDGWGINPADCQAIEIVFSSGEDLPYAVARLLLNEQCMEVLLRLDVVERQILEPL